MRNRQALIATAVLFEAGKYIYDQRTWCDTSGSVDDHSEFVDIEGNRWIVPVIDCGTTFCVAGHAAVAAGAHPVAEPFIPGAWIADCVLDGEIRSIESVAQTFLGLDDEDAVTIFDGAWTPADGMTVAQVLRALADGATVREVSS